MTRRYKAFFVLIKSLARKFSYKQLLLLYKQFNDRNIRTLKNQTIKVKSEQTVEIFQK